MIPRIQLEHLLEEKLKDHLPPQELTGLMAELSHLDDEWEEVDVSHREMGYSLSVNCPDICWLADQVYQGEQFKLYRKKKTH